MDLSDRSRCQWHGIEVAEDALWLGAEVLARLSAELVPRDRRRMFAQLGELARLLARQQVRPAREQLSQLDERRPESLARAAHPLGRRNLRELLGWRDLQCEARSTESAHETQTLHEVTETMRDERARDLVQSSQVAGRD